jgi:hypothetical protein
MFTFDKNQQLTGVVVNVPCPSQVTEAMCFLSADYWNEVRINVKKEFGEHVYVLPQCAPAGDLSPRVLHYKEAQARRMDLKYGLEYDPAGKMHQYNKVMGERLDIANRIMAGIDEVYAWAKKDIQRDVPVRHHRKEVALKRRIITEEEKIQCENNIEAMRQLIPDEKNGTPEEIRVAVSRYNSIKGRNTRALERYEDQKTNPTLPSVIHVVQIGEIAFASNRFELFMDYMHRIQARSPFIQTFVIQLAGCEGGSYLATERGAANKGYSASLFCNQFGYEAGQQIVEETLASLNEMKQQDEI